MSQRPLALVLLATLAACEVDAPPARGGEGPGVEPFGAIEQGAQYCPGAAQVRGVDVSRWQSDIDWDTVAATGFTFGIARASVATRQDTWFAENWAEMGRLGMIRGAYHYFHPSLDADEQADVFLAAMGPLSPGDLPPTLDVEEHEGMSPSAIADGIRRWMQRVEAATGRKPMIYTGRWFWDGYVGSTEFGAHPLWLAAWNDRECQTGPAGWASWTFHQYAVQPAPGFPGDVDHNRFDGDLEQLRSFAGIARCTPGCDGTSVIDAQCNRGDCAAYAGTCSTAGRAADDPACVSVFCVASADEVPVAHEGCWFQGGQRVSCDAAGLPTLTACPAGEACSTAGGTPHCAPAICPAEGEARLCVDGAVIACLGGSAFEEARCAASERCEDGPEGPACVAIPAPSEPAPTGDTGDDGEAPPLVFVPGGEEPVGPAPLAPSGGLSAAARGRAAEATGAGCSAGPGSASPALLLFALLLLRRRAR